MVGAVLAHRSGRDRGQAAVSTAEEQGMGFLRRPSTSRASRQPAPSDESRRWAAERFEECLNIKLRVDGDRDWVRQVVNVGALTDSAQNCWWLAHGDLDMEIEWVQQCVDRAASRLDMPASSLGALAASVMQESFNQWARRSANDRRPIQSDRYKVMLEAERWSIRLASIYGYDDSYVAPRLTPGG